MFIISNLISNLPYENLGKTDEVVRFWIKKGAGLSHPSGLIQCPLSRKYGMPFYCFFGYLVFLVVLIRAASQTSGLLFWGDKDKGSDKSINLHPLPGPAIVDDPRPVVRSNGL